MTLLTLEPMGVSIPSKMPAFLDEALTEAISRLFGAIEKWPLDLALHEMLANDVTFWATELRRWKDRT